MRTSKDMSGSSESAQGGRQDEASLRQIVDQCPAPILICRCSDDRILFESGAARELLGCVKPRIGASVVRQWISARDYASFKTRLVESRELKGHEVRLQRNDGDEFWCSISARVIALMGEEALYMSMIDLTDHHAAQSEIARQRDVLHDAEKLSSLGEVLAGISHELNNPLSVLAGQALMLKEKAPDKATERRAERISKAADRCSRIVRSFLALARQQPDAPSPVSLNDLVEEALELTGPQLRSTGVDIVLEQARSLPDVSANPDQLRQVFVNLIVNAQHALETVEGRRVVMIKTAFDETSKQVTVKVTDNGSGVAEENRSRIFEPLFTTKAPGKGTGVGLALCRRILEAHKGSIQLVSSSACGATFVASLPQIGATPDLAPKDARLPRTKPEKLEVLILDDDAKAGRRLAEIVSGEGHGVEIVATGYVGLERLKRRSYGVIFCRLGIEGTEGLSFFRSLSEAAPELARRVVFTTNEPLGQDARDYLDSTERPFVSWPLRRRDVREVLELMSLRATS